MSTWRTCSPMPSAVYAQSAVAHNTTVLMCGGWSSTSELHCYTYTPTKDAWSAAAPLNAGRWEHGMAVYKGASALAHSLMIVKVYQRIWLVSFDQSASLLYRIDIVTLSKIAFRSHVCVRRIRCKLNATRIRGDVTIVERQMANTSYADVFSGSVVFVRSLVVTFVLYVINLYEGSNAIMNRCK
jgi:hypothetical protein